jgi:hypothetical protein
MKNIFILLTIFLINNYLVSAQTNDLAQLLDKTQEVSRKTAYQAWVEYTSSFTQIKEDKTGKKHIYVYETLCSRKTCASVLVAENGVAFSDKQINKNREKAGKSLDKAEKQSDVIFFKDKENPLGYGILVKDWFNPSLYLKICKTEFLEKTSFENRPTIKISVTDCKLENLPASLNSKNFQFMGKTNGIVWIDVQDKAIVKMELYAQKEFPNLSNSGKPLVVMEAAKIPDGYWFWKNIRLQALENSAIFPDYKNNWEYEFYNYRLSDVEVKKVEINKENDKKEK